MNFIRHIAAVAAFVAAFVEARAELVWTPQTGWEIRGGVLANIVGENVNVGNALEAMNEGKKAFDEGEYLSAINYYQVVINEYPDSLFAPEAYFQISRSYVKRGQFENAFESLQEIIKRYPDYPKFNQVIGEEFNIANMIQNGATPYLWGWFPWFTDYNDAIKFYEQVVKNAPYGDYAPLSLMNISLVAEDIGKYETAFDALDRLINTYPSSMLTPDAYLQMANIYRQLVSGPEYDQTPTKNAISFFQDYLILFPNESQVAHAEEGLDTMRDILARSRLILGDFYYYYRNNHTAASIFYNETITLGPSTPAADEARVQLRKIADGVLAPMTPYDWFWGRYEKPSIDSFEDETRIDELNADEFEAMSVDAFLETPGASVGEVISPDGSVRSYESLGPLYGPEMDQFLFEDGFYKEVEDAEESL